jgi:hypothetical protein
MQTLLIKMDEPLVKPVLDLLKSFPVNNYEIRNIEFDIADDIDLIENKIAYFQEVNELNNNETLKLDDYMKLRGIK